MRSRRAKGRGNSPGCLKGRIGFSRDARTRSAALTPRQREVLQQIALGRAKTDIAYRLGVSVKTVETHCEMIMEKLCMHDRVELARLAIREGIIAA